MKRALMILMVLSAASAFAQQTPPQEDSPLVKAAKASGGPKKKSTKKVITNADVKKSNGKLVVTDKKVTPAATGTPDKRTSLEKQSDDRHAMDAATVRVSTAQKKVDDLTKELRRIEDAYYAENDPNYRDATIAKQFSQAKAQLDDARKELAEARDAQNGLSPKSQ